MATRVGLIAVLLTAAFVVGCTSDETAALADQFEGEFFVTGVGADAPAGEFPYGEAILPRFNGTGTAEWTGTGPEFESFSYTGQPGGTVKLGASSGYLSADGQVLIASNTQPTLWAGVRVDEFMDWQKFAGDYVAFMIGGHQTGPCWVRAYDVHSTGMGAIDWMTTAGGTGEGIYPYTLLRGVLSVSGNFIDDVTTKDDAIGAVTADGSVFFLAEMEGAESGMMVGIRRSLGKTNALWQGRYRIRAFSAAEPQAGAVACASLSGTLQADGAGNYSYSWSRSDGTKEAGSGTYSVGSDGQLDLHNLGIYGIVNESGDVVALSLISDEQVMLAVGVRD